MTLRKPPLYLESLAAAHVGEAIRLLRSIDRNRFEHITTALQPFVREIDELKYSGNEEIAE